MFPIPGSGLSAPAPISNEDVGQSSPLKTTTLLQRQRDTLQPFCQPEVKRSPYFFTVLCRAWKTFCRFLSRLFRKSEAAPIPASLLANIQRTTLNLQTWMQNELVFMPLLINTQSILECHSIRAGLPENHPFKIQLLAFKNTLIQFKQAYELNTERKEVSADGNCFWLSLIKTTAYALDAPDKLEKIFAKDFDETVCVYLRLPTLRWKEDPNVYPLSQIKERGLAYLQKLLSPADYLKIVYWAAGRCLRLDTVDEIQKNKEFYKDFVSWNRVQSDYNFHWQRLQKELLLKKKDFSDPMDLYCEYMRQDRVFANELEVKAASKLLQRCFVICEADNSGNAYSLDKFYNAQAEAQVALWFWPEGQHYSALWPLPTHTLPRFKILRDAVNRLAQSLN